MIDLLNERRRQEQGFTLVELLVVILIVGVLAAVAIPAFMNQRQQANTAALESDMRNMVNLVQTYYIDNDAFSQAPHDRFRDTSGWMIVALGGEDARFVGTMLTPDLTGAPADFPSFEVSEGSGIGVVTRSVRGREVGEFCIVGNMVNSPHEADRNHWEKSLYYDSRYGTIYRRQDLPAGGACNDYYSRWNPVEEEA